ncbi:MAG TPA: ABC transporter permease [Burkholderiales bacterium]|nr:ABC transporter permease [Burkholderiales bacterium]
MEDRDMSATPIAWPALSGRFIHVWRRNRLVWRKLAIPSILGNLADPMLYMLGLGYGLGAMVPAVNGMPYITFLAAGTVCSSTMMSASFEAMYSGFSRMHVQKTWDAILNAPITLEDVVLGEVVWAASKSFLSGMAVLVVAWALGLVASPLALFIVPLVFLTGLAFAGPGLVMTALSPSYDFFMYYFTLVITPMMLVCGVFFPMDQLPGWLQHFAQVLPLTHAVSLARPLLTGSVPSGIAAHLAVLAVYALAGFYVALVLTRRRLS